MNPTNKTDDLLGVVLVGGKSSRMGRDKATIKHPSGRTYLQFAIDRIGQVCDKVVLSGKTSVDHDCPVIADATEHQGPIQGIAACLGHAQSIGLRGCLVTPVDMPSLTQSDLARLVDAWHKDKTSVCAYSDRVEPLVAIYSVDWLLEIQQRIASGQRSLFRWIESAGFSHVEMSITTCHNVNTPQDLDSA